MSKKRYQALYTVELTISIEVLADDSTDAQEQFEQHQASGAEHLIAYGVDNEVIEWDSTLEPIKPRKVKK